MALYKCCIIITSSQNYIFNVHHITFSGGKFNIFLARTWTKNNAQNAPKYAISSEKKHFSGTGLASPLGGEARYPFPTPNPHPHQAFWIRSPWFQPDLRCWWKVYFVSPWDFLMHPAYRGMPEDLRYLSTCGYACRRPWARSYQSACFLLLHHCHHAV